jgi:hypothetical protein
MMLSRVESDKDGSNEKDDPGHLGSRARYGPDCFFVSRLSYAFVSPASNICTPSTEN